MSGSFIAKHPARIRLFFHGLLFCDKIMGVNFCSIQNGNTEMKKTELLAPAGGLRQYKAAVAAGADAIYLGGSMFNARMSADNFTLPELEDVMDYGHMRNVKTYVTLNTLLSDSEISDAVKYARELYKIGADAFIIQDLGLGKAIRDALPDMPIHLSTQATIYNREGAAAARELGYSRVVLARELGLEEIRECSQVNETEVFIHGALCMCYSGQCQLSRYIGGRSGNRGMCAQPCRLPYVYRDLQGHILGNTHPLSPKDLSLIGSIGELMDAGVSSFKIEGRMRSPEYVALTVSMYRKYIDQYAAKGSCELSEEDLSDLLQIFNRNGFTEGYINADPGESLMSGDSSKNTGIPSGRVAKDSDGPYAIIKPTQEIIMHDVLEIKGDEGSSFKVTYLEDLSDGTVKVGDIKKPVHKGREIYRLVSEKLLAKASGIIDGRDRKAPVDMFIMVMEGEPVRLDVKDAEAGLSVTVTDPDVIALTAQKAAVTEDALLKQLQKTGNTPFCLRHFKAVINGDVFVPVSALNKLRRQALDELEALKTGSRKREEPAAPVPQEPPELTLYRTADEVPETCDMLPYVSRGSFDIWLRANADSYADSLRKLNACAMVNSIGHILMLRGRGIRLIGGPALNVTNHKTLEALTELGMEPVCVTSPELLDKSEMAEVPLMVTEHEMIPGTLTDRKGAEFRVEFDPVVHKTYIYANE